MRWAAFVTLTAGVLGALSVAQFAPGQATERVRVAPNPPVASVPPGLFIVVASPNDYSRTALRPSSGSWVGPEYRPRGAPNSWGHATIDWELGFDGRQSDTERTALANLTRDWIEDQRAGVSVPHFVGGRMVGTIPGFFVLQAERQSAPSELVLAFPISRDLHAFVRYLLLRPESNDFYVNGSVQGSSWNRGQALLSMSKVKLEGNLPPSAVSIRSRRGGRVIAGFALDFLHHAVVGVPVALERRTGSAWRRVFRARTSRVGGYSFRVEPGTYRARASLGRFSAVSRPFRARKPGRPGTG
ncbi:MAG: hypothetical protein H0V79_04635 [Actinobacteria bacterium]|nr:hypothetical protein [Actinomycetota bacterium]